MDRCLPFLTKFRHLRRFSFCTYKFPYLKDTHKEHILNLSQINICDTNENKQIVKIKKIQEASKNFKTLFEELELYKQILSEGENTHEDINKKLMKDVDAKQVFDSMEILQEQIFEDLLEFYKNCVNEDNHLDTNEIKMEIVPGVGGQEARMFCKELFGMYENFCKIKNYEYEVVSGITEDVTKGRNIISYIKGKNVYENFAQEIGIHRVQRVPSNSKRIQTSTSIVLILDEQTRMNKIRNQIKFSKNDLLIETKRSSGAGGQSVNKNESCVRVLHKPTGIFSEVQKTCSQIENKNMAIELLKEKLYNFYYEKQRVEFVKDKKNQKKHGERSEKIRTYNFMHNVINDHVINEEFYDLENFFKGDGLVHLIDKRKQLFYQNIVDETFTHIFQLLKN